MRWSTWKFFYGGPLYRTPQWFLIVGNDVLGLWKCRLSPMPVNISFFWRNKNLRACVSRLPNLALKIGDLPLKYGKRAILLLEWRTDSCFEGVFCDAQVQSCRANPNHFVKRWCSTQIHVVARCLICQNLATPKIHFVSSALGRHALPAVNRLTARGAAFVATDVPRTPRVCCARLGGTAQRETIKKNSTPSCRRCRTPNSSESWRSANRTDSASRKTKVNHADVFSFGRPLNSDGAVEKIFARPQFSSENAWISSRVCWNNRLNHSEKSKSNHTIVSCLKHLYLNCLLHTAM